ncbi:MAG: tRNA (N(6)-L-threonylcarbamoyladenosine(37)-C(2))-methylthiotransferase MtaB, partial [Caldiserica bacterium]|nr:tRNA (N(6)-L-threonylcarbamoyladenosine(37)-C(2))-methylthiotransferase MtaB [Caldisericota bacterium]
MKVAISTLGCKTNQYESELIRESFLKNKDLIVGFKDFADLYIINSCVVTNKAEAETRKLISEAFNKNPDAKILLTGCFVSLHQNSQNENILIYTGRKNKIADFYSNGITESENIDSEKITTFANRTRAIVKIEEGCDNFCAYCIVPFVKGKEVKSKSREVIIDEIKQLVNRGYKEIVLTGTEIGKYGEGKGTNIAILLKQLKQIEGLERLRISSIHPSHVTDEFIEEIETPVVPHLHISLQSGDNKVLKKMNRGYTREGFLKVVGKLRKKDKNFSISTDLIVGFPGETEDAFFNSINIIREVKFSKVHIFRFSKRPYTPAFFMKETVSENLKKIRAQRLKEVTDAERIGFKRRFLGKTAKVLIENFT